jgi:multimeric flavodoxin WrbA
MRALVLNRTLKPSPADSNTDALARVVMDALSEGGVETELLRVVDHDVKPGVPRTRATATPGRRSARRCSRRRSW